MTRPFYSLSLLMLSLALPLQASPQLAQIEKWLQAGQYQAALTQLDSLLAQDRQNPRYLFASARALAGSGQLDKAVEHYQSLVKRYPDLPEPYNNLAVIYVQQGKHTEAQSILNRAMATHPGYDRVYKNLTALNTAKARDAYAKALQMPSGGQVKDLLVARHLSLPDRQIPSVQAAPLVTNTAKPAVKPVLVYQASRPQADKNTVAAGKKPPPPSRAEVEAVKAVLQAWAVAWSTKSVDEYLHFYSDDYAPGGMTHQDWVAQRRARIARPRWIRVKLQNLQVMAAGPQALRVRLEQEYAADNYRDVSRKEFVLQNMAGQWRIIQERGLGYITK